MPSTSDTAPASIRPADAMSRLGTETAFQVLARAAAMERDGRSIINLGIGQPDFKTADHIVEAAAQALRDGHHGYTPARGIQPLREAVAADLQGRHGVDVSPERVVIVPGGKVTMWFAILMFGQPGAEIIYPDPGFPIYGSVIRYTGATPVAYPLLQEKGFAFDPDAILASITPATRLLIVNSPANPTGGVVPPEAMDRLVAGLAKHPHVAVMSDEIYSRMLYPPHAHRSLLSYPELEDRLILLDGWSKTYAMTGWRLGFGVWPSALIDLADRLAVNSHSCVNAAAQMAAIAALTGPQDAVDEMLQAFTSRRRVVVDGLNSIPGFRCVEPGGAFYAFPDITATGLDARTMQDRLLTEAGVATVAGTSFGGNGEGFIRLSYANSIEAIEEALQRVNKFVGTL
ncbi:pyridoxal phosphate-dependent aminotransferase [Fodinicurvata sp. EGI_FJ10296]|uniref:pyridoxal phosphate-dependent aminotransferase n=1 Tax=Fodinicurvata sp. EGI_FJ10296 TaxID=3231908 RepID=UPI003456388D